MNPIEKDLKNYYGTSSDSDILEQDTKGYRASGKSL